MSSLTSGSSRVSRTTCLRPVLQKDPVHSVVALLQFAIAVRELFTGTGHQPRTIKGVIQARIEEHPLLFCASLYRNKIQLLTKPPQPASSRHQSPAWILRLQSSLCHGIAQPSRHLTSNCSPWVVAKAQVCARGTSRGDTSPGGLHHHPAAACVDRPAVSRAREMERPKKFRDKIRYAALRSSTHPIR
jgi:hypothetical protein